MGRVIARAIVGVLLATWGSMSGLGVAASAAAYTAVVRPSITATSSDSGTDYAATYAVTNLTRATRTAVVASPTVPALTCQVAVPPRSTRQCSAQAHEDTVRTRPISVAVTTGPDSELTFARTTVTVVPRLAPGTSPPVIGSATGWAHVSWGAPGSYDITVSNPARVAMPVTLAITPSSLDVGCAEVGGGHTLTVPAGGSVTCTGRIVRAIFGPFTTRVPMTAVSTGPASTSLTFAPLELDSALPMDPDDFPRLEFDGGTCWIYTTDREFVAGRPTELDLPIISGNSTAAWATVTLIRLFQDPVVNPGRVTSPWEYRTEPGEDIFITPGLTDYHLTVTPTEEQEAAQWIWISLQFRTQGGRVIEGGYSVRPFGDCLPG